MTLAALDFSPFRPRFPWWGGDLQTLRNVILRADADLSSWPEQRVFFDVSGGDRLPAARHDLGNGPGKALVLLIHGLSGCEDSRHVRISAHYLLTQGYAVLRLNLRGSAPARATSKGHYHAGKSEDLAAILAQLDFPGPVTAMGYSLGANILLKYLGEAGAGAKLDAAVAVSAPLDLAATSARMHRPRNRIYHDHLLRRMKDEALAPGAEVTEVEARAIHAARKIRDFDDGFVAPRNGYEGAKDYYEKCSGIRYLEEISKPTLLVHAADDPWVDSAAYRHAEWDGPPALRLLFPDLGGHVGFHGVGDLAPWHDCCAVRFFEEVLK